MGFLNLTKNGIAVALSAQLVLATVAVTAAQAEMLGTEAAISKYAAHTDRSFLLEQLQRDDVQTAMIAEGVNPAEAAARLNAMTDVEVASLVTQMENDSAGADIVGTLFTVFIILLVTDILCLTRIFNFTRCIR